MKLSNTTMKWVETTVIITIVVFFSITTYQRNFVWKDDISLWTDVIKKSPEKARPYLSLALGLKNAGYLDEAISTGEKGMAFNLNYTEGHFILATFYNEKGLYDKAISHLLTAMLQKPGMWQIYGTIAMSYIGTGRSDDAISAFQEGLKLNPSSVKMRINLAGAYITKDMLDPAIRDLRAILADYPNEYEAHYNLGIVYSLKGEYGPAVSEIKEALRLRPDYTRGLYYLADIYQYNLHDRETALSLYRRILVLNKLNDPFIGKAEERIRELGK